MWFLAGDLVVAKERLWQRELMQLLLQLERDGLEMLLALEVQLEWDGTLVRAKDSALALVAEDLWMWRRRSRSHDD